ncbi:hypothetical protein KMW28_05570 [Flammeovirga yaeyamensis]|uniref:Uncharacterized protein n=1 Tax=Flammeovirga yaeyamensis TaxID=367791 RepID=A0AAX1N9X9_9BACT|nr:hypothetical protein [Flammeovirga yaeyamensis]MBB3697634.1 hypothetical protein [Flammeovirga yaeyamensis]NMF36005.1 hypothetical protein [Flammeovirga yaeyamensis]QWG03050.1 hypothetical protein KMW28_05570 [Flammeovirga yaeyamensis]
MDKKLLFQIGLPVILLILIVGIIINHKNDSYKEELSYKEYEKSSRDSYLSFKTNILNELKGEVNLKEEDSWQQDYNSHLNMTASQFEGPQVHIDKFVYYGDEYYQDSVFEKPHEYKQFSSPFTVSSLVFDPDERTSGKPDIRVTVVQPKPYEESRSEILTKFLKRFDGGEKNISPYRTYFKEVYSIRDSTIIIENIKMDLWLTKFSVTVETESWTHNREDEDDNKREIANQRHKPFNIFLEIIPNVSPWYVNTGNAFDKKADMAVGAIYCEGITKKPKDNWNIGVTPKSIGTDLPLIQQSYYNNLNNPNKLFNEKEGNKTVWNKSLFAVISVQNIGSYRKLTSKGDEQVTFDFIMPLLVRGSWDIQIPSSIIPEYEPTPPYRRSLSNILLPKWGLGIFGQSVSLILFLIIILCVGYIVLKVMKPF